MARPQAAATIKGPRVPGPMPKPQAMLQLLDGQMRAGLCW